MEITKTWISVDNLINKRREYEMGEEIGGDSSYYQKLASFIAKRDLAVAKDEDRLARRRAKLILAAERKKENVEPEKTA